MNRKNIEKLINAENIFIYGAGVVASRAISYFENLHVLNKITGICTSKNEGISSFRGLPVTPLDKLAIDSKKTVFILAVSQEYLSEIQENLNKKGFNQYIVYNDSFLLDLQMLSSYTFEDRRKRSKKLCMILSGYKEWLWQQVFDRVEQYVPDDIDVCILSSGIRSETLGSIAEKNGWSYLSTEVNCLTLIQNIAINLFENAEMIFKMDEDIFLTKNCFETMIETEKVVQKKEPYKIGFVAPLIPVNGYGHIRILDELQKRSDYETKFDRVLCGGFENQMIEKNAEASAYMWGIDGSIPKLDCLNRIHQERKLDYSFCNVRFSIGFIMFHRELWQELGGFRVNGGNGLGQDEVDLCSFCMVNSRAIVVAENTVVGHFSFGKQTSGMRKILETNPELFARDEAECE